MLSLLLMLLSITSGPKLQVNPHFGNAPATVTLLVTNISERARVACFVLDGPNYYGGCQEVNGRQSIRVEYRNVLGGMYVAAVSIDDKVVGQQEVTLTGRFDDVQGDQDGLQ